MVIKTFEVHCNCTATDEQVEAILDKLEDVDITSLVKSVLPDDLAKLIV